MNNEPAFPGTVNRFLVPKKLTEKYPELQKDLALMPQSANGMTLRDYFAGQALIGVSESGTQDEDMVARLSYRYADAMLAEREKGKE